MDVTLREVFISEVLGTGMLLLLGAGVVANAILLKTKGFNGGWLLISFGWGLGVFAGVYTAFKSGAHINPAVTLGLLANGAEQYAEGVDVTAGSTLVYVAGQMVGAFLGAVLAFLAYKPHFDEQADGATKLAVFSTGPGDPLLQVEPHHRGDRHVRAGLRGDLVRQHALGPGAARRRPPGGRDRREPRWSHGVRHQPRP